MNRAPAGDFSFGGLITISLFCALAPPAASLRPACGRAASFAARRCRAPFALPTCSLYIPPCGRAFGTAAALAAGPLLSRPAAALAAQPSALARFPPCHSTHHHNTNNHSCWCRVAAVAPASRETPAGVIRTDVRGLRPLGVGLRPNEGNYSRPLRGLARRFASHQSSAPSAVAPPSRPLTAPHTARRV